MTALATLKEEKVTKFQTRVGKAIEDFLSEKGKQSKATETAYRGDITIFLDRVLERTIATVTREELELLDYDSFKRFLDDLKEIDEKSNSGINRCMSAIKSLYRELNVRGIIKSDIQDFGLIKALPKDTESYESIPMEVALEYIEATKYEKHKAEEKKYFIKTAIETGLRESELRELEWTQFKVDGKYVFLKGFGKGNKKYIEKMSRAFYDELLNLKVEGQKKIFTLSKKNVADMMTRITKLLGYEDRKYTFHSFKKTAVTNTYRATGSITDAQEKGKHSDVTTTRIYLEDEDAKMTGYFSLEGMINHNKYKEVTHEELILALQSVNKDLLFMLNMKLEGLE